MQGSNNTTRRVIAFLLIATTLLLLSACEQRKKEPYQGYIDDELNFIASSFSGTLQKLYVSKGQYVKKGDPLYQLDPQPQKAKLKQAQHNLKEAESTLEDLKKSKRKTVLEGISAQIKQAEAEFVFAKKNLARFRTLVAKKAAEELQLDSAKRNFERVKHRIQELKSNLAEAKLGSRVDVIDAQKAKIETLKASVEELTWQLEQKRKVAPAAGRIFDRFYHPGEHVPANQPIIALQTTKDISLTFYIPQTSLKDITLEQTIYFTCDNCKQSYGAKISFISSEAEFTPPVIFSRKRREKLIFLVEADLTPDVAKQFNAGQPVDVYLTKP